MSLRSLRKGSLAMPEENDSAFSDEIANAVAASFGFPPVVDTTRSDQPLDLTA